MEKVLLQQNRHWQNPYEDLIDRDILSAFFNKLSLKEIQIVLGMLRAGKLTLFKLLIKHSTKRRH